MNPTLNLVSFIAFTAALSSRAVDPVIPQLASALAVDPPTAAMLSAAFAVSYGLVQPVLGPIADMVGKTRVMTACLVVLMVSSFLSALVTSFPLLMALRVIAGAACGGTFPVALAFVGDQVPIGQRQVAIGRLLAATISGNLIGSAVSGIVADAVHWRWRLCRARSFRERSRLPALSSVSAAARRPATRALRSAPFRPTSAPSSPIRAPAYAMRPCCWKACSCSASFPMSPCCCTRRARAGRSSRASCSRRLRSAASSIPSLCAILLRWLDQPR